MQKYDIITVGGGFAGTAAAIAAARRGRKVLLIEKYNCLGGAAMFALVQPFAGYRTVINGKQKALSAGIFTEILDGVEAMGGLKFNRGYFNEEILKIVLQRMALKSGVELLFNTTVSGVQMDSHGIQSLTLCHIGGEERVSADYYIDATGDANLTYMAGYPFQLGRKKDNRCQPMTLCFRLANVKAEPESPVWREMQELYRKKQAEGKIRNPREDILWFQTLVPDIYHFNTTRIVGYNPTDVRELTKAETEAREQMFEIIELLKSNYEEFRDCIPISSGLQIGARESRMIAGEHTLTQEEIVACTKFEDRIAASNYDIDIHSPDGSGTSHYFFKPGTWYTVPYRCLVPVRGDNLLVAGRCISATHEAQASLRIMPPCCSVGEAAGTAAAIAFEDKTSVRTVDVKKLQSALIQAGAFIG